MGKTALYSASVIIVPDVDNIHCAMKKAEHLRSLDPKLDLTLSILLKTRSSYELWVKDLFSGGVVIISY